MDTTVGTCSEALTPSSVDSKIVRRLLHTPSWREQRRIDFILVVSRQEYIGEVTQIRPRLPFFHIISNSSFTFFVSLYAT